MTANLRSRSSAKVAAMVVGALALWTSAGALAIATPEAGAARVGVLPSPLWLLASIVLVSAAVFLRGSRSALVLWASAPLLLPWLPVPIPNAAFVWAGPLRIWIWIGIAAAFIAPPLLSAIGRLPRPPVVAAAIAALCYLAAARQIAPQLPGGDEPHYLIITQSLLKDGDLEIQNNHDRGDYHEYFFGPLRPDYLRRGKNGEVYSVHAPGLPAIVAPVFALFGYPGVLVFLAIAGGCATGLAWSAAWRVTGDRAAAWFGWATVSLTVPFAFQAFTVYPDGLGAAFVMAGAFTLLMAERASMLQLVATGIALGLLPWLHTRFAVSAGMLGIVIAARLLPTPDRARRLTAFLAAPAAMAVGWFLFFYILYGSPNPAIAYNGYTQSAVWNIPRSLIGLLFDQQFGLLPNAPAYLCAFAGFIPLARRQPRVAGELAAVIVPYALAAALFYMWWGGFASPARFLASMLLVFAIPAAMWFSAAARSTRTLGLLLLAISIALSITTAAVDRGALLYNVRDGASKMLIWASGAVDLTTGLPSLFQTGGIGALGRAAIWLAGAAAVAALAHWLDRRDAPVASAAAALTPAVAVAVMTALSIVWSLNRAAPILAARAGTRTLRAIDGAARQLGVAYSPFRRLRVDDIPPLLPLTSGSPAAVKGGEPLASIVDAPAAAYTIEATLTGTASTVTAGLDRSPAPLASWDVTGVRGPWRRTLTLANDAHLLRVDGVPSGAGLDGVRVRAERRLSSDERVSNELAWRAARYGSTTVFLLDGRSYVETGGCWIVGGSYAEFAIVRAPDARVHLFVRNSGAQNRVTFDAGGWHDTLPLAPREERLLDLPIAGDRPGVVLQVTSPAGARPFDFEPGSQDKRFLGVWIETR